MRVFARGDDADAVPGVDDALLYGGEVAVDPATREQPERALAGGRDFQALFRVDRTALRRGDAKLFAPRVVISTFSPKETIALALPVWASLA